MANQKISLVTVEGLSTGRVFADMDVQSKAVQTTITNKNAIRQSIRNILSFRPKERVLYPEFGNRATDFVFDRITDTVIKNLDSAVREMLLDEPRIKVDDVNITANADNNEITVKVGYTIQSLGVSDSISMTVRGTIL